MKHRYSVVKVQLKLCSFLFEDLLHLFLILFASLLGAKFFGGINYTFVSRYNCIDEVERYLWTRLFFHVLNIAQNIAEIPYVELSVSWNACYERACQETLIDYERTNPYDNFQQMYISKVTCYDI